MLSSFHIFFFINFFIFSLFLLYNSYIGISTNVWIGTKYIDSTMKIFNYLILRENDIYTQKIVYNMSKTMYLLFLFHKYSILYMYTCMT